MANSSIIGKAKNKIIREFIKDDAIVKAIGSSEVKSPEKLIGTHIFDYHQNPNTLNTVGTFITIQVHIPNSYYIASSRAWVNPTIEIWIISHWEHMVVDNIDKITENRNDYLSRLIDNKLNGNISLGFGDVELLSNEEGAIQTDYVYRNMLFECTDLNKSLCSYE